MNILSGDLDFRQNVVKAISWIGLAYGIVTILNNLVMLITIYGVHFYRSQTLGLDSAPYPHSILSNNLGFSLTLFVIGHIAVSIGLVTASVGMLKYKEWGRNLAMKVMVGFVFLGIVFFFTFQNLLALSQTYKSTNSPMLPLLSSIQKLNLFTKALKLILIPGFIAFLLYRDDYRQVFSD